MDSMRDLLRRHLLAALVILLMLPLGVILALRQTRLGSKAAGTAILSIAPTNVLIAPNTAGTFDVFLDPRGENVAGMDVTIRYDFNVIGVTDVTPGAFFNSAAGSPQVLLKDITTEPGIVRYSVAFPLGSQVTSSTAGVAATIRFTSRTAGSTVLDILSVYGTFRTVVTNGLGADVLGTINDGNLIVNGPPTGQGRLYFAGPNPANPQAIGTTFNMEVRAGTGGQSIDGLDARIRFDSNVMRVVSLSQGPVFASYPAITYCNANQTCAAGMVPGQIEISANIGSGDTATPVNGDPVIVAGIVFMPFANTAGTSISYLFNGVGDRNDSNMVLYGSGTLQDPIDILGSVTNANIVIGEGGATPTNTPVPTVTGAPTLTPTPGAGLVTFRFAFEGRLRAGVSRAKTVTVIKRTLPTGTETISTVNTNSNGEAAISVSPGSYIFYADTAGYLKRRFGTLTSPVVIATGQTVVDFTSTPLKGGDLTSDGIVNAVDYTSVFLQAFLSTNQTVDLDGSGLVNNLDFSIMRRNWFQVDDILQ